MGRTDDDSDAADEGDDAGGGTGDHEGAGEDAGGFVTSEVDESTHDADEGADAGADNEDDGELTDDADEDVDGGDRLLDVAGVVLVGFLVFGVAVGVLAAAGGPSQDVDAAPDADWTFERVNDSHVRIVHAGGERVPSRDLVVTSDGVRRRGAWPDVVAEGESGTVRADEGVVVRLYWTTETGERVKLDEWQA